MDSFFIDFPSNSHKKNNIETILSLNNSIFSKSELIRDCSLLDDSSIHLDLNLSEIFPKKKGKKKKKKKYIGKKRFKDLNDTPLPIFSCIYCANEKVSFNYMIHKTLFSKYGKSDVIYNSILNECKNKRMYLNILYCAKKFDLF
jgi:hypothetical protein